jgi:FixJ family two-component response regulator
VTRGKRSSFTPPGTPVVVIVDDDASMGQAIARMLRFGGYAPVLFCSAEALIASGGAKTADCFVLDVHLPGLTGFELHQQLLRQGATAPVIFISADEEPETGKQAELAGAAAYLAKPFSGHALTAAVARAIAA